MITLLNIIRLYENNKKKKASLESNH